MILTVRQISDLAFRRHILVQALILLEFLLSLTAKAKGRLAELTLQNKSVLYQFTLGEEDVGTSSDRHCSALTGCRPNGQVTRGLPSPPICRMGPRGNSTIGWWTRSCRGTRTGSDGRPKTVLQSNGRHCRPKRYWTPELRQIRPVRLGDFERLHLDLWT